MQDVINQIARDTLRIETLETRNSDSLDYHDLAVWEILIVLQNALPRAAWPQAWKPTPRSSCC